MKKKLKYKIDVQPDLTGVSKAAAEEFVRLSNEAISARGIFTVVLSGGNTPGELYKLLASDEFRSQIVWENVYFFFGDERDVSPASNQSNFNMVNVLMFKPLQTPKAHIFRWQTEIINAPGVADQYEKYIRKFFKIDSETFPQFDLVLLGLGEDGHTASLFPHSMALDETQKIAVANLINQRKSYRLTMSYPVLNNAENIIFLVSGESKSKILQKILEGEHEPEKLPAQGIKPASGNLLWLVDEDAAQCLKK